MAKPLRVLCISGNGQVGGALYDCFRNARYPVVGTWFDVEDASMPFVDISDPASVRSAFETHRPECVVLNAALTNVEYCETHPEESGKINVAGVENVAAVCTEYRSSVVFFSSDYVFDGLNGPYDESATLNPINVYGTQKVLGEEMIQSLPLPSLIIRTTVVYGKDILGKNFVVRLVDSLQKGHTVRVPTDQVGTPTYAANLAECVVALVDKNATGIYNVVGRDRMSRYDFACHVCDVFGLNRELIIPVTTAELKQNAARPLAAGLSIDKLLQKIDVPVVGVRQGLLRLKDEMS